MVLWNFYLPWKNYGTIKKLWYTYFGKKPMLRYIPKRSFNEGKKHGRLPKSIL